MLHPVMGAERLRVPIRGLGQLGPGESGPFTPPPAEGCPDGQFWDGVKCSIRPGEVATPSGRAPAACRQADGSWDLYDPDSKQFVQTVPNTIVQGTDFPSAPASLASEGFCQSVSKAPAAAPTPPTVSPSAPTAPATAPSDSNLNRTVVLPDPAQLTSPSGCQTGRPLQAYPAGLGQVPLRLGRFW